MMRFITKNFTKCFNGSAVRGNKNSSPVQRDGNTRTIVSSGRMTQEPAAAALTGASIVSCGSSGPSTPATTHLVGNDTSPSVHSNDGSSADLGPVTGNNGTVIKPSSKSTDKTDKGAYGSSTPLHQGVIQNAGQMLVSHVHSSPEIQPETNLNVASNIPQKIFKTQSLQTVSMLSDGLPDAVQEIRDIPDAKADAEYAWCERLLEEGIISHEQSNLKDSTGEKWDPKKVRDFIASQALADRESELKDISSKRSPIQNILNDIYKTILDCKTITPSNQSNILDHLIKAVSEKFQNIRTEIDKMDLTLEDRANLFEKSYQNMRSTVIYSFSHSKNSNYLSEFLKGNWSGMNILDAQENKNSEGVARAFYLRTPVSQMPPSNDVPEDYAREMAFLELLKQGLQAHNTKYAKHPTAGETSISK